MTQFNGLPFSTGFDRSDVGQYGVSLFRNRDPHQNNPKIKNDILSKIKNVLDPKSIKRKAKKLYKEDQNNETLNDRVMKDILWDIAILVKSELNNEKEQVFFPDEVRKIVKSVLED